MPPTSEKVSLIKLPEHVLLDILGHLSAHDVLSFRMTCSQAITLTQSRALWVCLYNNLCTYIAPPLRSASALEALSASGFEKTVKHMLALDSNWTSLRPKLIHQSSFAHGIGPILDVILFPGGRWLLGSRHTGINLWDLGAENRANSVVNAGGLADIGLPELVTRKTLSIDLGDLPDGFKALICQNTVRGDTCHMQISSTILSSPPVSTTLRTYTLPFAIKHATIFNNRIACFFENFPGHDRTTPRTGLVVNWEVSEHGNYMAVCISEAVAGGDFSTRARRHKILPDNRMLFVFEKTLTIVEIPPLATISSLVNISPRSPVVLWSRDTASFPGVIGAMTSAQLAFQRAGCVWGRDVACVLSIATAGFRHLITVPCGKTGELGLVTTEFGGGQGSRKDIVRFRGVWACEREVKPTAPSGHLDGEDFTVPAGPAPGEGEAGEEEDSDESDVEVHTDLSPKTIPHLALFTDRQGTHFAAENGAKYFVRYVPLPYGFQRDDPRQYKIVMDEGRGRVVLMIHEDHPRIFVFDFAEAGGRL